jgi:hypothetical protein
MKVMKEPEQLRPEDLRKLATMPDGYFPCDHVRERAREELAHRDLEP